MGKQACTISRMVPANRLNLGSHANELETLPRRLSRTGDSSVWWSVLSECSRAGEALFSMVRRDREWELEEGAKEAAW